MGDEISKNHCLGLYILYLYYRIILVSVLDVQLGTELPYNLWGISTRQLELLL